MKRLLVLICLFVNSSHGIGYVVNHENTAPGRRQIETVSFCELTNHSERYVNRTIKTSAIFLRHFPDVWFMYDEECSDKSNRVTDYLRCKPDAECDRLRTLSSMHRDGNGERWRNRMVVIGELQFAERESRSGDRTRVLKFAISDIESVSAVPENVSWP